MAKLDYLRILALSIKETTSDQDLVTRELILEKPLDKGYSKHLQNLT